jgi:hypothetical protein
MNRIAISIFLILGLALLSFALFGQDNVWKSADSPLKNPSFEIMATDRAGEPESWNVFTESGEIGLSRLNIDIAQHGTQSMGLGFDTKRDKFVGIAQDIDLGPGQKWKLSGFFRNVGLQGASHARLGLEWKNAENVEISRMQSPKIERTNISDKEWTRFSVEGIAPGATAHATVTVTLFCGESEEGSILADTIWLEQVPPAETKK